MNFATHRLIFNPHRGQFVPVAEITRSHGKGRRAGLNARAANITSSQGNLLATAGNNINLTAGEANAQVDEAHQHKDKGLLSKKTITTRDTLDQTAAQAATLSGQTTTVLADRDINLKGSNIVSDNGTTLAAQNNLTLGAATHTATETHLRDEKKSGLFSGGGIGITIGTQQQSTDQKGTTTTATASTVGSTQGNIDLQAGKNYAQTGSYILAPQGNIDIAAQKIDINEARETRNNQTETRFKQSGLTLALTSPVITAIQTAQQMGKAANDTSDPRMKALAAANIAFAGKNAMDAIKAGQGTTINGKDNQIPTKVDADGKVTESRDATATEQAGGINLSISIGGSSNQSKTTQTSDQARESTVAAGNNLNITASGSPSPLAGEGRGEGDLTVQGSSLQAGNRIALDAQDEIRLLAAKNTADQHSTNSSKSGSVGISIGTDGFLITASASGARGNADGSDVTWANTHVEAGNQVTLQSGGDTTLKGAVVQAPQITAHAGGDLNIESLQDTSQYDSKQQSLGGSISIGYGKVGGSFSASKSKVDSDFASVTEQSGIKAGDGGFSVNVQGDTDLKGGAITSTQQAIDDNRNNFSTGGELTTSDIQNQASYKASSVGVSIGTGGKLAPQGSSAGIGKDSGNASSTTQAAISGIAGNKDARTGDAESGIQKIFDADKVQKEINAQVRITQTFGQQASKAIGDYAAGKTGEAASLRDRANKESDPGRIRELKAQAQTLEDQWGDHGTLRLAAHTLVGGLTGGASGAAGAAAGTLTAPEVAKALNDAGVDPNLAKTLTAIAGTTAGALVGGTAGAGAALNEVTNNYLKHQEILDIAKAKKECNGRSTAACGEVKRLEALDKQRDATLAACEGDNSTRCTNARQEVRTAYAEIIRKSDELFGLIAPRPLGYEIESSKTQREADKTISAVDRTKGGVIGLGSAIIGGLVDVAKGGVIYVKAVAGNEEAGEQLGKTVDGVIGLASSPELWGKILTNATQEQHAKIADAYEKGDGEALGKIAGEVLSNLVGGGIGTVGKAGKAAGVVEDIAKVAKDVEKAGGAVNAEQAIARIIQTYGPHEIGPLGNPNDLRTPAATFRSGTYMEKVAETDLYFYRDYGGVAKVDGRFWTPTQPRGPLQSQIDSAVLPEWGNTFENQAVIKIPKGTTYYEGYAASQTGTVGMRPILQGGGVQVFLPSPKPDWIIKK